MDSDTQVLAEMLGQSDSTPLEKKTFLESLNTPVQDMNLGTPQDPKMIKVYSKMTKVEYKYWKGFFKRHKSVFAWNYSDLKGVPPEICEHKING